MPYHRHTQTGASTDKLEVIAVGTIVEARGTGGAIPLNEQGNDISLCVSLDAFSLDDGTHLTP